MKLIKTSLLTAPAAIVLFAFVIFACTKDACDDVVCLNGGTCASGVCNCPSGYTGLHCENDDCAGVNCLNGGICESGICHCPAGFEGPNCELESREKFLGVWVVTEDGTNSPAQQYSVSVQKGAASTELYIQNFNNKITDVVRAFVAGETIYIPDQTVGLYTIIGTGTVLKKGFRFIYRTKAAIQGQGRCRRYR